MLSTAAALNLLFALGLILFVLDAPARKTWARLAAVLVLNGLTLCYVVWRYDNTLPSFGWEPAALWPWAFFCCGLIATAHEVWTLCVLTRVSDHSAEADAGAVRLRAAADLPEVDVFIPTYSEGAAILEETLAAALALDYPAGRLRVWVLDDGRRPWLETLCRARGAGYFTRPTNEHGKAGNLNHALPRTHGAYILIIDADFVLRRDFLYRTLGFLLDRPDVGIVQTPQHFRNPDPVQHNLLGARAWTEEQHFFMTVGEPARDSWGNAFCVGSGWVVRRSCLEELGGFPQESLCEDLEISYVLLGRGRRTLFLNEPLAVGLAPESLPEYLKQRVRWCTGTIQQLYLKTGPLRGRGLSLRDRLFYLEPVLYYLTCPFIVLLLLAPVVFWYTGLSAIPGGGEVLLLLGPRLVAGYILMYWLSEWKVMPPMAMVHKALTAFHLTGATFKTLVNPFGRPFRVTAKGEARAAVVVQWRLLALFAGLALALLGGMFINLTGTHQIVEVGDWTATDVAWSLFSLVVLGLCALVCVELPKGEGYLGGAAGRASVTGTVGALLKRLFS